MPRRKTIPTVRRQRLAPERKPTATHPWEMIVKGDPEPRDFPTPMTAVRAAMKMLDANEAHASKYERAALPHIAEGRRQLEFLTSRVNGGSVTVQIGVDPEFYITFTIQRRETKR